jgi:hypothetical protein
MFYSDGRPQAPVFIPLTFSSDGQQVCIALDVGLIAAGQAVKHYEMARYGTLRTGLSSSATPMPLNCPRRHCSKKCHRSSTYKARRSGRRQRQGRLAGFRAT